MRALALLRSLRTARAREPEAPAARQALLDDDDARSTSTLSLSQESAGVPAGAEPRRELQPCRGCGQHMQPTPEALCFCCWYGLDRSDFPAKLMPIAQDLAATLGPAGRRGVRVEQIRAIAREKRGDLAKTSKAAPWLPHQGSGA